MSPDLAFNTAVSFATNTNWQSYAGESTCSYLAQMLALAFHNWVSAATGICVAIAFVRGFARSGESAGIGNFWRDLTRSTLYILLPLTFICALVLSSQGVIQNFDKYTELTTLEGAKQSDCPGAGGLSQEAQLKCSAPMAGAITTPTAPIPMKIPRP